MKPFTVNDDSIEEYLLMYDVLTTCGGMPCVLGSDNREIVKILQEVISINFKPHFSCEDVLIQKGENHTSI